MSGGAVVQRGIVIEPIKVLNIKNKLLSFYNLFMTFSAFLHRFIFDFSLRVLFIVPIIFSQPSDFIFSSVYKSYWWIVLEDFLWLLTAIKQFLSLFMSMHCSTSFFSTFLLLMFILLFSFSHMGVLQLFKNVLYWSLLNLYVLLVLTANVIVLLGFILLSTP